MNDAVAFLPSRDRVRPWSFPCRRTHRSGGFDQPIGWGADVPAVEESQYRIERFDAAGGCITRPPEPRSTMSNIQVAGARTLPFTGLATLPIVLIGSALSLTGVVLTLLRPKPNRSV
jgi:hypothetical protein